MSRECKVLTITAAALLLSAAGASAQSYDPLAVAAARTSWFDDTVHDAERGRDIPIRVHLPAEGSPAPVILFSHGLGGSREGPAYLAMHWTARGYVSVFIQHPGSDDSVWRNERPLQRMRALRRAADTESFMERVGDVPAVLDQLERWNRDRGHRLAGRMEMGRVGMAGHSFGAVTAQAVSGQRFGTPGARFTDPRIRAALPMSPSPPRIGTTAEQAFGGVQIPWLLMTGTEDDSPIGDIDPASRREVYPALPPGSKYELVLDGAEHSAFGDRELPGDRNRRNPNHHRAILALSTAFWDAYLRSDPQARAWLDGTGPRSLLEERDLWQRK